ncbi:MAG: hypothetical protein CL669_06145 [Balneola sp.]|nr:hypothetical protein [Balneola sp.]|tara:strand:+ start:1057 stop:1311 length:255 start_codon:yes stop_codon:yes gene_type:complete
MVKVGVSGVTVKSVKAAGVRTVVKRVTVGKPLKNVSSGAFNIDNLGGVNTTTKTDGAALIFNTTTGDFEATTQLEKQTVNGGHF